MHSEHTFTRSAVDTVNRISARVFVLTFLSSFSFLSSQSFAVNKPWALAPFLPTGDIGGPAVCWWLSHLCPVTITISLLSSLLSRSARLCVDCIRQLAQAACSIRQATWLTGTWKLGGFPCYPLQWKVSLLMLSCKTVNLLTPFVPSLIMSICY